MLMSTDRRDEARAMLAGIYNWFTEGFDTAIIRQFTQELESAQTAGGVRAPVQAGGSGKT